jgi:hypothetical protein
MDLRLVTIPTIVSVVFSTGRGSRSDDRETENTLQEEAHEDWCQELSFLPIKRHVSEQKKKVEEKNSFR